MPAQGNALGLGTTAVTHSRFPITEVEAPWMRMAPLHIRRATRAIVARQRRSLRPAQGNALGLGTTAVTHSRFPITEVEAPWMRMAPLHIRRATRAIVARQRRSLRPAQRGGGGDQRGLIDGRAANALGLGATAVTHSRFPITEVEAPWMRMAPLHIRRATRAIVARQRRSLRPAQRGGGGDQRGLIDGRAANALGLGATAVTHSRFPITEVEAPWMRMAPLHIRRATRAIVARQRRSLRPAQGNALGLGATAGTHSRFPSLAPGFALEISPSRFISRFILSLSLGVAGSGLHFQGVEVEAARKSRFIFPRFLNSRSSI